MSEYIFKGMTFDGNTLHARRVNDGYPVCGVRGCCWNATEEEMDSLPRCKRCESVIERQKAKEAA